MKYQEDCRLAPKLEKIISAQKDFKWVKDKVKAFGVWLSTNPKTTIEANYSEKLT